MAQKRESVEALQKRLELMEKPGAALKRNAEVEKAAQAFGERNREALTELAKW